jgi:hypothetical protein
MRRLVRYFPWLLLCGPGLYQLGLLVYVIGSRFLYPYDLEWMEGGILTHAQQYAMGKNIYAQPSVDFISFVYTPLYPMVLAGLGKVFGLSYQLGRAVSVVSIAALVVLLSRSVVREARPEDRGAAWAAAACSVGFFAATYPWVEGWYDLVRGDLLALSLAVLALVLLRAWAKLPGQGPLGLFHAPVALCAALLALSFFGKQVNLLFCAAGGVALVCWNPRAVPIYGAVLGLLGGGGSYLLNLFSGGWYWTFVYRYLAQHDHNRERFRKAWTDMLWHFPAISLVVAAALVAVLVVLFARRRLPRAAGALFYWTFVYAVALLMGAMGWAHQWAHFNVYIPAMTTGAIAAGLAVLVLVDAGGELVSTRWRFALAALALLGLCTNLVASRWSPKPLIPTAADVQAGDRLIKRLSGISGEIFFPFHPWYSHLAGKRTYAHRMAIMDVTYRPATKRPLPPSAHTVQGLAESLRGQRFAAVILDDRAQLYELPGLTDGYRPATRLGRDEAPRTVTGALTVPHAIWLPKEPLE